MGQRHQIYIRIHNPLKKESIQKQLSDEDVMKHAKAIFGNKKYSILAYHHQWLFGMTAVATCNNILESCKHIDKQSHPFSKDYRHFPYPSDYEKDFVDGYLELIEAHLFNQFNFDFAEHGARMGIERVNNLSDGCYDRKTGKYERKYDSKYDFTSGDNNDGVTIIDTITGKYCFVNIFTYPIEEDEKSGAYLLTPMKPYTAAEYAAAYYPIDIDTIKKGEVSEEEMKERIERIEFVEEKFQEFDLLTVEELKKMFPETYKEK